MLEHKVISEDEVRSLVAQAPDELRNAWTERDLYALLMERRESDVVCYLCFFASELGVEVLYEAEWEVSDALNAVLSKLNRSQVERDGVIPFAWRNGRIFAACLYPCDFDAFEQLVGSVGFQVEYVLTTPHVFHQLTQALLGLSDGCQPERGYPAADKHSDDGPGPGAGFKTDPVGGLVSDYLDWMMRQACAMGASDLHIEAMGDHFVLRCRKDGKLETLDRPDAALNHSLVSHIKVNAGINIAEKRLPQDGRFSWADGSKVFDCRVSTVPTTRGESIAIRILEKTGLLESFDTLGMSTLHQVQLIEGCKCANGLFLITGPTGSGKSTTLYAWMSRINHVERKLVSVEDPVEYSMDGVIQVQVCQEAGLTFASALRSILRQAPEYIMIGEIRDKETAQIASNAALTGHSVYSTLHTNDAPGAVIRLMNLGVSQTILAAALRWVIAQRLVRCIAPGQAFPYLVEDWQLQALGPGFSFCKGKKFYRAGIQNKAYKGRTGVFECFVMEDDFAEVFKSGVDPACLRRLMEEKGYPGLRHDAVEKAGRAVTTLEEVFSVVPLPFNS